MAGYDEYTYYRSVSRAREERVKEDLREIFPSFADEIERLRIRHHMELFPLVKSDRDMRSVYNDIVSMYPGDSVSQGAELEHYIAKVWGKGMYAGKRTILSKYFSEDRRPNFSLTDTDVHEFIHYITQVLLDRKFGAANKVRNSGRFVPAEVREAIAFAFQKKFLEHRKDPTAENISPDRIAEVYSKDYGRFNAKLFKKTYQKALELVEKYNFDEAAKRIPELVAEVLGIRPRNPFKRR